MEEFLKCNVCMQTDNFYWCEFQITGIMDFFVGSWSTLESDMVSVERVKEYTDLGVEVSKKNPSFQFQNN